MEKKFRRNLLLGFSASLIILLISSIASYVSIQNLLASSGLVNHTNTVIVEINQLNFNVVEAQSAQRGYLLMGNDEFISLYDESRRQTLASFKQLSSLTKDNVDQQRDLLALYKLIEERFYYLDVSINDRREGREVQLANLQKGREIMIKIRDLTKEIQNRENILLAQRTDSMNRFASFTPVLIVIAAVIALFVTVSFYVRVRNDIDQRMELQRQLEQKEAEITARINIIQGIAEKISNGNYEVRVNDQESDALGSVGGALNRMAQSLQYSFNLLSDKEWMQSGLAQVNDVMMGEKSLELLSNDVVEAVARYTDSNVGALHILDNDGLIATGGYAFEGKQARRKIAIGEGLVGQAFVSKKPIHISNIPAENVSITFATGELKPTQIIAVPVLDGYSVKGVIQLATVGAYASRQIEFLTAISSNIGIAITTAQNRLRLQELLEETQSQSEELKSQHSELENLNSELEVQAEKLQASEEELKVQQEELKQANQELEERSRLLEERNQMVSERNVEIQQKADQLAESTRYKSEFLANMSHELRTPLNSILLLSRLIAENQERNLSPEQVEYARVIQSSGHGLLSLIDEILDLSKIEAGKMKVEYQSVSLKEIIGEMTGLFGPVASEKGVKLTASLSDEVQSLVETDKLRLEQILRNLLSNAIKFTSVGTVALSIRKDERPGFIRFSVDDTGIGIPKEKQRIIFDAFQQADGSTRRKFGGTGLGLSISRELVKLLGGELTVVSEVEKGSTFTFAIPLSKVQNEEHTTPASSTGIRVEELAHKQNAKKKYISTDIPENIPDDRGVIQEGDSVILIIEDDVNFAKSLLEFSRRQGYRAVVAVRGDEGIELAKRYLPVGILLDIQLPIKSGWEVMEELKSTPETRHLPVHIMSSHEVKSESLLKGAVDFINKPVAFDQMQEIFKKIEYVLKHHPKKVLIVEENAKHAKALAYFLETFDINLEIKQQVDQAIDSLRDRNVDCVILDMGIPDQRAYDTLEAVKRTKGLENLPIIVFTGKSLSLPEELRIKQYADSIVVKTAHSYQRILDEVSLFLHLMEKNKDAVQEIPAFHKLGALDDVLKGKNVLIADDDMRNIFSLTHALERYKMNVIAAVDGKDALKKLEEHPEVDIVLMDMMMPEMDGYESTAAIRKNPRHRNLPVIAVTAKAMMGDRVKCIDAGASDYITKPVDIDQLLSLLRVWLYEKI